MKIFIKKSVVVVCILAMVISLLPIFAVESAAATSLTEEQFALAINEAKKEYPHNYYWNQYNGKDSNNIAKAGTIACKGYSNDNGKSCVSNGYCAYNGVSCTCLCGYYHGWQCFGFGNLLAYKTLGSWATNGYSSSDVNSTAGWKYYKSVTEYYAGDFVRINNNHTIFIHKIDGNYVYYAECNANGACKINWEGKMSVSQLKSKTTFVVHKSGNTLKGTGASSNALTINYNANGGTISTPIFVGDEYKVNTSQGINIRSGPGTSYSKLGGYSDGQTFRVTDYKTGSGYTWGKINFNGKDGWIAVDSGGTTKIGAVYEPDYYISSSTIYKKSTNVPVSRTWSYGYQDPNGLHDDTTFGLYRDGYTFLGWSLSPSGGTVIPKDKVFTPESIVPELFNESKTITVYAIWEADVPVVVDKTVESISISSIPAKLIYYVGENSNQSEISIIAKHTDGSYSKVTEGFTCSPSIFTSEGTQNVTVNYSGKTATYSVRVTKAKEQVNNATAKVNSVGHHSPSLTSKMFPVGAYAKDNIQVFCKNGDFYLCLIPWGEDTTTISCGAIMYIDIADVTLKSAVPDATEFFSMNPSQANNAVANTATKLYWKANLKAITYDSKEIAPIDIAAGTAVKVLFEMNGNYCVESGGYIGFAAKSHFTLNSTARGLQLNKSEIDAIYGETISTAGLTVEKVMSDGTAIAISNYSLNLPSTTSVGTKYALVTSDNFSDFIKINVVQPTIKVINLPQKSAYYFGESFDKTGIKVVSVGTNGNETDITSQISLSYDFSEAGHKSVNISYAGATTYVPVLVYSQPVIEVGDVMGYQGQTVTLPIYYYNTCEYTFPTSFKIELSYDNTKLEYVSANIPSLTQNGQMIVNSNTPGKLIVTYADAYAVNDADVMLSVKFNIRSLNTSYEDTASVMVTNIEFYDGSGKKFESEVVNGQVCTCGKFLISYYNDGEIVDSYYKNYGDVISIIETIPTKNGYAFLGWSSSSESLIPEYYAKDTLECYENMALYAVWKINQYAVKYDANNGSGTMVGRIVEHSGTFELDNCTLEAPAGKRFKAWAIGSVNGEQKQPGQTITITSEINIYAIWEEIPVLEIPENAPCIVVDTKDAVIGSTVTVKISLTNNPGVTSIRINVGYDSTLLILTDVEYNTAMGGQSILPENIEALNGNVVLYWADGFANYEGDDVFATLTFNVSAAVDTTTTIAVTYDAEDIYDADESNVTFFCEDGIITFIDYTPGDISGDGVLNSKDVTRLMRYLADWDVEVNEVALDVNGDGVVNTKDTTRLMRYLADWDVEIY